MRKAYQDRKEEKLCRKCAPKSRPAASATSDTLSEEETFPGIQYPRVPGHEVAGIVDAVDAAVARWTVRALRFLPPRRLFACQTAALVTGITSDGGYADYLIARAEALAMIPDDLAAEEAAPLMRAGSPRSTVCGTALRPGDVVAVLGLGGLGHLGIQFAAKMGFRTVAIARGQDKESFAKRLGAWHFIDNQAQDAPVELRKFGGAKAILAHERGDRGTRGEWNVDGYRGYWADGSLASSTDWRMPIGERMVFGYVDRFARYSRV